MQLPLLCQMELSSPDDREKEERKREAGTGGLKRRRPQKAQQEDDDDRAEDTGTWSRLVSSFACFVCELIICDPRSRSLLYGRPRHCPQEVASGAAGARVRLCGCSHARPTQDVGGGGG
jgi:hypothetical protein